MKASRGDEQVDVEASTCWHREGWGGTHPLACDHSAPVQCTCREEAPTFFSAEACLCYGLSVPTTIIAVVNPLSSIQVNLIIKHIYKVRGITHPNNQRWIKNYCCINLSLHLGKSTKLSWVFKTFSLFSVIMAFLYSNCGGRPDLKLWHYS